MSVMKQDLTLVRVMVRAGDLAFCFALGEELNYATGGAMSCSYASARQCTPFLC